MEKSYYNYSHDEYLGCEILFLISDTYQKEQEKFNTTHFFSSGNIMGKLIPEIIDPKVDKEAIKSSINLFALQLVHFLSDHEVFDVTVQGSQTAGLGSRI